MGTVSVKVMATDNGGLSAFDTFDVAVVNTNDAPTLATVLPDRAATEDAAFGFTVPTNAFADVDVGDRLTYSAARVNGTALPSWLTFSAATRTFSGVPRDADVGALNVKVAVTDLGGLTASDTFELTVADGNNAPVVVNSIADRNTAEDLPLSFQVAATTFFDADARDTLAYAATRADGSILPGWLNFDAATRTLSGTPSNDEVGTLGIRIVATDPRGLAAADVFDLTVTNVNDAPMLASALAHQSLVVRSVKANTH